MDAVILDVCREYVSADGEAQNDGGTGSRRWLPESQGVNAAMQAVCDVVLTYEVLAC